MAMHDAVLAAEFGPSAGHLEAIVAAVGLGIVAVLLLFSIVLLIVRRGRPLVFFGSGVVALFGTVVLLSFV